MAMLSGPGSHAGINYDVLLTVSLRPRLWVCTYCEAPQRRGSLVSLLLPFMINRREYVRRRFQEVIHELPQIKRHSTVGSRFIND